MKDLTSFTLSVVQELEDRERFGTAPCVSQRFARFPTLLENQASARRDMDEKSVRGRHDTRV